MKTFQPKHKDVVREWHHLDANGMVLGRLATEIAILLMGKHKPTFSKHMDSGDFVVVTNVEKIKVTGKKEKQKVYRRHSGFPGGLKEVSYEKMKKEHPERILEHAVKGMLPNNRLLDDRMVRLKLIIGSENPYKK
jgi:large subunit ribosomal protein L13